MTALTLANSPRSVRYRQAHDLVERAASGLGHGLEVVEGATGLRFDVTAPTMSPVAGSSGIWPEKYTVLPARTACEYGPMAAGRC